MSDTQTLNTVSNKIHWYINDVMRIVIEQSKLALAIFPHLITEAAGYILASMSGLFLAKAIINTA